MNGISLATFTICARIASSCDGGMHACRNRFAGLSLAMCMPVRIEPRDRAYPRDEAGSLSMMIYQKLEREAPFMKFWFEDQSTIEIAADKLTLNLYSEKVIPVSNVH